MHTSGEWNMGWNFITNGTETSYFPAAGYIGNTGSSYSAGSTGYYFASDPTDEASTSNTQVRNLRMEKGSCMLNTANRAEGHSIRCVRE